MRWFDRAMLVTLAVLFTLLVGAAVRLAASIEATTEAPRYDIEHLESPPTTPPTFEMDGTRVCVADGDDTNWAARFGVPDEPSCP